MEFAIGVLECEMLLSTYRWQEFGSNPSRRAQRFRVLIDEQLALLTEIPAGQHYDL